MGGGREREEKWEKGEKRGIFMGEGEEEEEQGLKGKAGREKHVPLIKFPS